MIRRPSRARVVTLGASDEQVAQVDTYDYRPNAPVESGVRYFVDR
jgi:hypothetical protein